MVSVTERVSKPARATPLTVADRRAMIIDAVTPLLLEQGRDATSKQIADAAGVAEGTIFRAFGDKESLIRAVLDKLFDPEPLEKELERIDPRLELNDKVHAILALMKRRFGTVFQMMAVLGSHERPPVSQERRLRFAELVVRALEPDAARLNVSPERVAHVLRLLAVASSFPALNTGIEFTLDELTEIVLYGVAGHRSSGNKSGS